MGLSFVSQNPTPKKEKTRTNVKIDNRLLTSNEVLDEIKKHETEKKKKEDEKKQRRVDRLKKKEEKNQNALSATEVAME